MKGLSSRLNVKVKESVLLTQVTDETNREPERSKPRWLDQSKVDYVYCDRWMNGWTGKADLLKTICVMSIIFSVMSLSFVQNERLVHLHILFRRLLSGIPFLLCRSPKMKPRPLLNIRFHLWIHQNIELSNDIRFTHTFTWEFVCVSYFIGFIFSLGSSNYSIIIHNSLIIRTFYLPKPQYYVLHF